MNDAQKMHRPRKCSTTIASLLLLVSLGAPRVLRSQTASDAPPAATVFRLEKIPVGRDAELLTVFGSLNGIQGGAAPAPDSEAALDSDVPLVSVLRDTLGDEAPENDRLRYVWMLTYTRPGVWQRVASAVPFLYGRVGKGKKKSTSRGMPPAVIDLAAPEREVWQRFMWMALRNVFFNPYGLAAKSTASTFHHNSESYRRAHIMRALAILSLYEAETGEQSAFSPAERTEIQGRLMLTGKSLGGLVDDAYLQRISHGNHVQTEDTRGHNWELLRQRAEAEGLYFEPLTMPDGSATHALLWVARTDLEQHRERRFDRRFLNIAKPWGDARLGKWRGHTETWHFDAESRVVPAGTEGARAVEMLPLALYGLDHPKIPSLLIDFRDGTNPKRREMSQRVLEDISRNLLALSRFGDVHYFLGRTVYDFVTSRRGMDINQPSRLRAYSQLKLLLSLDASLDPSLREEIGARLERVSLNPLENDLEAEAKLARDQYAALVAYAARPDGLPSRLDRARREEMVALEHGKTERVLLRFARVLSLGLYRHREHATPEEQRAALDRERQLAYHRRFLREVSKSAPLVEVAWNIEDVRRSLRFVSEQGAGADAATAGAAARIFAQTGDEETRRLCLNSLYRINNETAKKELLRIYQLPDLDPGTRLLTAEFLRRAVQEEQRIAPADAKAIASVIGQ
ncbi:MAG TPA: hypothetical protein VE360_15390 [Pyrinomonadaceae bacterium]|nr:hypothetical protein [Pyrinomonadaceae bacterium]